MKAIERIGLSLVTALLATHSAVASAGFGGVGTLAASPPSAGENLPQMLRICRVPADVECWDTYTRCDNQGNECRIVPYRYCNVYAFYSDTTLIIFVGSLVGPLVGLVVCEEDPYQDWPYYHGY